MISAGHLYQPPAQTNVSFTVISVVQSVIQLSFENPPGQRFQSKIYLLFTVEVSESLYQHYLLHIQELLMLKSREVTVMSGNQYRCRESLLGECITCRCKLTYQSSKGLLGAVTEIRIILIGFFFGKTFLTLIDLYSKLHEDILVLT